MLKKLFFLLFFSFSTFVQAERASGSDLFLPETSKSSDTGLVELAWQNAGSLELSLERSFSEDFTDFTAVYTGVQSTLVVSGLPDGVYFFRLRNQKSEILDVVRITVEHHSTTYSLLLFLLGGLTFLMVCLVILRGER